MHLSRRQIYRRRRIAALSVLAVVLTALIYGFSTGLAPLPANAAQVAAPVTLTQPAATPEWPGYGTSAIGAVGFDGVLASQGSESPVPIASIAKAITALVILEAKPLGVDEAGPDITFTEDDIDIYYDTIAENGSSAPVSVGMVLSQREALEAMLLPSANNYAKSLAIWAYGSEDAYLAAAASWLSAHGLTGTTVVDTSGLSAQSVSTPSDLVEIGKLVKASPAISEIVSMKTATLPTIGEVTNTNKMLGINGVNGIKTGTTDEAGACLLFSADITVGSQTVTLIGFVLGGDTHSELNESISELIDSVKTGFHEVQLTEAGVSFATYTAEWGQSAHAVTAEAASTLVWSDTPISGTPTVKPITTGDAGESVGSVDYVVGTRTISVPLVLDAEVSDPGLGWRLTNPTKLG